MRVLIFACRACNSAELAGVPRDEAGVSVAERFSEASLDGGLVWSLIAENVSEVLLDFVARVRGCVLSFRTGAIGRCAVGDSAGSSSSSLSFLTVGSSVMFSSLISCLPCCSFVRRLSPCLERFEDELVGGNSHSRPPFLHPRQRSVKYEYDLHQEHTVTGRPGFIALGQLSVACRKTWHSA